MSLKLAGAARNMLAARAHLLLEPAGAAAAVRHRWEQALCQAVDAMAAEYGVNLQLTFFAERKALHLRVQPSPPERPAWSFGTNLGHSLRQFGARGENASAVSATSRVCQLSVESAEIMVLEYAVHLLEEALHHRLG